MIIYDKDVLTELIAAYKPVALDINAFRVKVEIEVEKSDFKEMANYSTFLQEMQDAMQTKVIALVIANTARELGKVDRAYYALTRLGMDAEAKKEKDRADKLLKKAVADINTLAQNVLNEGWARVLKVEKNVKIMKIKAVTHIVISCVALSLSIASLASTPVTAVGAVAGALGIVQSLGSIITNVRTLVVRVESLAKDIQLNLNIYRKKVEKLQAKLNEETAKAKKEKEKADKEQAKEQAKEKAKEKSKDKDDDKDKAAKKLNMKSQEAVKVAAAGLTGGVSDLVLSKLSGALPSLDNLKSEIALFGVKIDELEASLKDLSKDLNKLMDKSSTLIKHYESLELAFNDYLGDLSRKGATCPTKVMEAQAKVIMPKKRKAMDYEKKTAEAIKKIDTVYQDVKAYRTLHEDYDEKIKAMLKIHKTEGVAVFTKLLVALGSVAVGGAGGSWDKAGDVVQGVYSIGSSLFDASADTVIDLI